MPQIDFYISNATALEQRLVLACRLADKAYRSGHKVYIHCANDAQAQQLDEWLWSFQPSSYVPHALTTTNPPDSPVRIGSGEQHWSNGDVLINLNDTLPANFSDYARVLEVVVQDAHVLDITRQHWRLYKQAGCDPQRRELGAA